MSTVAVDIRAARRSARAVLVLVCEERVCSALGTSLGIPRCRKDGFVVGDWMRQRARAWECRRAEMRAPREGRDVESDAHCGVVSRRG
jgi:hypothetical protein